MALKHRFVSAVADGADATKLRPSNWGSTSTDYASAPTHVFDGGALGALLARDTGSTDGSAWIASASGVLASAGAGQMPTFRPLTTSDIPQLDYASLANLPTLGNVAALNLGVLAGTVAEGNHLHTGVYEPVISTLGVARGGTGLASYTVGDLIYASGATTLSKLASGAGVLASSGAGQVPVFRALVAGDIPALAYASLTTNTFSGLQTMNGGLSATTGLFSSTLGVTGNFAINTNKLTVASATGNLVTAGTLTSQGMLVIRDATGADAIEVRPDVATQRNVFVGTFCGQSNTIGNQNVAIGHRTFIANTTGSVNTAVGRQAMLANTTGNNNTALGTESLTQNTTGQNNTAIGYGANSQGNGSHNTAVGMEALYASNGELNAVVGWRAAKNNTSGSQIVAIGAEAMFSNTTADTNVAVGRQALYTNTTSTANTAVGYLALKLSTAVANTGVGSEVLGATTTGASNSAFGQLSMWLNTTGAFNTAAGAASMLGNTTGGSNAAFGYSALRGNTTGSLNVGLGYEAGRYIANGSTDNATTGTSVYVGANTKASASGNANEIVIGYNATGAGSNTVTLGNTSITTTILRGQVRAAGLGAFAAGDKYLVVDASGNIHISALGPAS